VIRYLTAADTEKSVLTGCTGGSAVGGRLCGGACGAGGTALVWLCATGPEPDEDEDAAGRVTGVGFAMGMDDVLADAELLQADATEARYGWIAFVVSM
jgi:hypothetical protein